MKSKAGFTLIEIMVALVILTLMSAAAVAGLHHMIQAKEKQAEHHERYLQLVNAYAVISQDVYYAIRLKPEATRHGFVIEPDKLRFSRTLTHGPQHVAPVKLEYAWDNQVLKRIWQDHETVLVSDLDDVKVWVLTKDKLWVEHQHADKTAGLPLALKFILSDNRVGEVTWSFTIAE